MVDDDLAGAMQDASELFTPTSGHCDVLLQPREEYLQ
jgi:hypothetical protein